MEQWTVRLQNQFIIIIIKDQGCDLSNFVYQTEKLIYCTYFKFVLYLPPL